LQPVRWEVFDMDVRRLQRKGLIGLLLLALAPAARTDAQDSDSVDRFRSLMNEATTRMHGAMHVPFTGDADRDFARMMIPHHQGAIDMALVELRYGKDERLKRLAQEIIVTQQQEIDVMHLALGDALSPGSPAPTQISPNPHAHGDH
jgi:Domain of unknown function (DUF305)